MDSYSIDLAPLMLIKSGEAVFAERAIDAIKARIKGIEPQVVFSIFDAMEYEAGQLALLTSPSLFGERRAVIITGLDKANPAMTSDVLDYISAPEPDVWIIMRYDGEGTGKKSKILAALSSAGVPTIIIPKVKPKDRANVVLREVTQAKRSMSRAAVQALIEALGSDVRELLIATDQLLADIDGKIDVDDVRRYFSGRVEATGFNIADAVIEGNTAHAVELLRHAEQTGVTPLFVVSALATKFRNVAQVIGMKNGAIAINLGMNGWVARQARQSLRLWSERAVGIALTVIAQADFDVKGGSREPWFALEHAILAIGKARHIA